MKLLEPDTVKEDNKKSDQDRAKRVGKLNEEESAITKRINQLHDSEREEKRLVREHVIKFKHESDIEIASINKTIKSLSKEVQSLEKRKAEALAPITEIKEEAQNLTREALKKEHDNKTEDKRLKLENEVMADRLEAILDKEAEISERDIESVKKNNRALDEEARLKDSNKTLSAKWIKFYEEVDKANADLARREKEIADSRLTNENFKKSLDTKELEQKEHDRQIADRYGTLGRAIEEARQKHGVNL